MTPVSTDHSPPHGLDEVISFVNTRDLDQDTDALDSPAALRAWLSEHGHRVGARVGTEDLAEAIALREALRAVLLAHNGAASCTGAARVLDRVAAAGGLGVRFGSGGAKVVADGHGIAGALAGLLVPIARASTDGTWDRVKACCGEDCAWAFYDRSRNRSARWCDMAVCGNRVKVRAYRDKRSS